MKPVRKLAGGVSKVAPMDYMVSAGWRLDEESAAAVSNTIAFSQNVRKTENHLCESF